MNDTTSSGPASANDAQLTGRFAEERKHGFRSMPEPAERTAPKRAEREERTFETGRQAADELAKRRREQGHVPDEPQPVGYWTNDKSYTAPANETITIERGAADLTQKRTNDAIVAEITDRDIVARQVDKLRKDAGIPTDPTAPVDPNQIDPHVFGDLPHQAPQIDQRDLPADIRPQQHTPGVDVELERAMTHPQVRAELEAQFGKVAQQVNVANDFAVGAFNTVLPELANLRPDQVAPFLEQLKRTNPQRYNQAVKAANNVAKAGNARQVIEQQRTQREQQEFQRFSQEQDRAFDKMVAHRNYTPQQKQELGQEAVAYAADLGIDAGTLRHVMMTNPALRSAAFQKVMHDALVGRMAAKSLATQKQQQRAANIPPVARPGHSNSGVTRHTANLQTLNEKLNLSGSAKDAAALLIARRNAKRR
jgi:hypothetical protein